MPAVDRDRVRAEIRIRRQIGAIGRRRKVPRQRPPNRISEEYARALSMMEELLLEAYNPVLEELPRLLASAANERFDAGEGNRIRDLITRASVLLQGRLRRLGLPSMARRAAGQVDGFQRNQWRRQVQSGLGADVFQSDRTIPALVDGFVAENVALIKDIAPDAAGKLERRITRAVASGERHEAIAGEIESIISGAGKRARLIARDQVGKLYGQINASRQQELGVTHFTWRTVGDKRVRPEHAALDGRVFAYSDPPSEGLPGQPILCRCNAEPVFDTLLEDL